MTDNKKEVERAELHRTIWAIADEMRGSVDGWDFKSYILGMLFYRYISENITSYINSSEKEAGMEDFDFGTLTGDLAAGLPAEIEKRRQQYEYYRDNLLTFKRKDA